MIQSVEQLHPVYRRSRAQHSPRLHAAAESDIWDVRVFGGVWYETLHRSGGLPKRLLRAAWVSASILDRRDHSRRFLRLLRFGNVKRSSGIRMCGH